MQFFSACPNAMKMGRYEIKFQKEDSIGFGIHLSSAHHQCRRIEGTVAWNSCCGKQRSFSISHLLQQMRGTRNASKLHHHGSLSLLPFFLLQYTPAANLAVANAIISTPLYTCRHTSWAHFGEASFLPLPMNCASSCLAATPQACCKLPRSPTRVSGRRL